MEGALQSHTGCVRTINEDSGYFYQSPQGWTLAIVADGVGGHQAGEVASQMAVELIQEWLKASQDEELDQASMEKRIREAIQNANEKIYSYANEHENCRGMGTTVVLACLYDERCSIAHIGDSRVYIYRDHHLHQITEDHSLVNELLRSGQINEEEAFHHPQRNIITRALGTEAIIEVELQTISTDELQSILLCSDGLSDMVPFKRIEEIISMGGSVEERVALLIQEGLNAGGDDNITALLIDCGGSQEKEGSKP
ncbi:Stp1/IreP family PP2C-type Ser/Thr phosphatase [Rubeoparvulum massiliense]|uniref:Stp1/IreP family PP2C-type Ser/Thr phosphatase n=1 Tax=Rubeoparvulum massiliense TaxID=1631346 RepID=UPI00065E5FBC|nr:Stp1/IreP family PP2C-type Ser/Thr phosphatase [Rubeoparvulum massiliense]